MKRSVQTFVVSVLSLLLLNGVLGAEKRVSEPTLKVTVGALKESYRVGEAAILEVTIENIGKEALLLSSDIGGHIGRLVTSPSGERLVWPEDVPPGDRARTMRLEPGCFCGTRKSVNMGETGNYKCRVVYVGDVSGIVPEMWRGRVESQEIIVKATKE